ncbi:MAG: Plug and carboxypeptidase regulatory-like domain-containing protein [Pyrinomonadaceae bacterium]|nr:Plug and carboxypeptidase regulatory-like domain-containing protein [Pyrinomonadaceae bacterium]
MRTKFGLYALLVLLGVGLLSGVSAQTSTTGNISGNVRDPSGAAVPKAEVEITEVGTGASRTVTADDDGHYSAQSLATGRYTVSTAPQGFKKTVAADVELHVGENRVVNLDLTVGQVTETVTVTSDAAPVETRSGDVSSLVSEKQVTELPLNGRNYSQLVLMVPGVSANIGGGFAATGTGLDGGVDMSVNGNGANQNLWTVDGVNNMDVGSNRTLLVFPSIDSIAEFRVMRNSFSAEYGQAQGAVVNLITKSGNNQFHGTAFYFLRDDSLNATEFFLNRAGQPKAPLSYKNYGGNFSGPIIKNRLFFFWNEEWRNEKRGVVSSAKVPTVAEKIGDFSGTLTGGLPHQPGMTCSTPGPTPTDPGCFPGNKIPTAQLSPAGLAILKFFPDPTTAASGNNWIASPLSPINTRQDNVRIDVNLTSKMSLMGRFINEKWTRGSPATLWGDTAFPTLDSDWNQPSKSFAIKLTNTLTSTSVNEFQFSRAGNDIIIVTNEAGADLNAEIASKLPTVFPRPDGYGMPTLWGVDGYPTLWHQAPWQNHEALFIWKDDFAKVAGPHDIKVGVLFSHNIKDELNNGPNGSVQVGWGNARTGSAIADLLVRDLPLPSYSEVNHDESTLGRWHDFEIYGNDTWKFRPNVTLTLGLRYSRFPPPYSDNDHLTNFIPRLYNGTNPTSALVQAGQNGFSRSTVNAYNMGFQPRVGIAWDIKGDGKTALRAGFGRYLSRTNVIQDLLRMASNPPWTQTVSTSSIANNSTLFSNPGSTSDPTCNACRSLDTIRPGVINNVAGIGPNTGFNSLTEDYRPPESYQWNLTLSRELMKNTVLEVSYIGNHGIHIWRNGIAYNEVVPSARLAIAQALRAGNNADTLITNGRRLRGVGPINLNSEFSGNASYNGLQVWLNRRFADRLSFQAAYTWSHNISDVATAAFQNGAVTDPFNYKLDRGDADLDRRQMFVVNGTYILPSFKNWGRAANLILGDWQLNGIGSFLGGVPVNVTSGANTPGFAAAPGFGFRPNLNLGVPIYLNNGDPLQYLNPAAFSLPGVGQFGTLGRGSIRAPGTNNVDFSLVKNWTIKEGYNIQFRTEMFNVFNHANFTNQSLDANLNFQNLATDANFGRSTNSNFGRLSATRGPREIQFGFKFTF